MGLGTDKKLTTNKEYLLELQKLADKHASLKEKCEGMLKEGDSIEDKVKESERVFAITDAVKSIMFEMDEVENKYYTILDNYKNKK